MTQQQRDMIANHRAGTDEAVQKRRESVFNLRIAGASMRAIAKQVGVSAQQVHRDIAHELAESAKRTEASADHLRQLELERLDRAMVAIANQVQQGNLGAIDRWVRLSESRRKLLGIDAPERKDVTHGGGIALLEPDDDLILAAAEEVARRRTCAANGARQSVGDDAADVPDVSGGLAP